MPANINEQQLPIDFDSSQREAKVWLISAMGITEATEKERAVVDLVYRITNENGGALTWTLARIGQEFCRDRQTMRRWINAAVSKGLLMATEQKHVPGGQRCHALSIDWESVRRIACQRGDAKARNRGINSCAKPAYQNRGPGYQNTPPVGDFDTPIRNNCAFTAQLKPPPTPAPDAEPLVDSWKGVGEELLSLKMATGRTLVEQLARLMTPLEAMAVIGVWKAAGGGTTDAAWGLGALRNRLLAWQPGQTPGDRELWAPPSEAFQHAEERRRRETERARSEAAALLRRATFEADRRRAIESRRTAR